MITLQNKIDSFWKELDLQELKYEFSTKKTLLNQNSKLKKELVSKFQVYKNLYGLELMPYKFNGMGKNLCPNAGNCSKTCLVFSGFAMTGKINKRTNLNYVLENRIKKTYLYLNDKEWFINKLDHEIKSLEYSNKLHGNKIAIRLNVFSDLNWSEVINNNKNVLFYDYTKIWSRKESDNYHLTYSYSERIDTFSILEKLDQNKNVAIVFNTKYLPSEYLGYKVINGNLNDYRFLDEKGVIIGLSQKNTIGGKVKTSFIKEKF